MQWPGTTGQSPSMASAPSYTTIPNSGAGYTTVPNADVSVLPTVVPPAPMYPYASTVVPPVPSPADNYTRVGVCFMNKIFTSNCSLIPEEGWKT